MHFVGGLRKATDNPYGYTQFKLIIQEYEKAHDYKYHNVYEAAKEMQFDFAGDPLWVLADRSTGECVKAIVLVCVLPFSMMSFAIAMLSTKMEFFFAALSKECYTAQWLQEVSASQKFNDKWLIEILFCAERHSGTKCGTKL